MSAVTLARPWLSFDLGASMRVLSWAINRPGFVMADRILWREVRNADLPENMDVRAWFKAALHAQGAEDAVAFLTSRDVTFYTEHTVSVGQIAVHCVATVGLSNAERVGQRVDRRAQDWGTINIAVRVGGGLTEAGLIEALSIVAEARTAAVMDVALHLPTGVATGTGTDCIAVAAPVGAEAYAGLHTDLGEALGAAVYKATHEGAKQWQKDIAPLFET